MSQLPTNSDDTVSIKPLFWESVAAGSQTFLKSLLSNYPELQSAAIVLSWQPPLENLPTVFVTGQSGPISGPSEIIRLQQQTLSLQQFLQTKQATLLSAADALMAEKAKHLQKMESSIAATTNHPNIGR